MPGFPIEMKMKEDAACAILERANVRATPRKPGVSLFTGPTHHVFVVPLSLADKWDALFIKCVKKQAKEDAKDAK